MPHLIYWLSFLILLFQFDCLSYVIERRASSILIIKVRDNVLYYLLTMMICIFWDESVQFITSLWMIHRPPTKQGYHFWWSYDNSKAGARWVGAKYFMIKVRELKLWFLILVEYSKYTNGWLTHPTYIVNIYVCLHCYIWSKTPNNSTFVSDNLQQSTCAVLVTRILYMISSCGR